MFKVGQKVKILRKPTDDEISGWNNGWRDEMYKCIGKSDIIRRVLSRKGYKYSDIDFKYIPFGWPECVLQSAEIGKQLEFSFMKGDSQ